MSSTVIKVENLSKQYRLGEVSTGSIAHDINRFWYRVRGKEDPYLKIGEENDRTSKGNSEYVWALQDINFEVKHGDIMGIIGRNGAGKSTLLKILSRTTAPTIGSVKVKGRVASLLEVGTGFHPELSGRDNIFLNGAILGMTKREIKRKFDEIVDFSGVERYIDTPVKRYSSGMYVRLAFAVAAHLDSEILIVDEVLAVGDIEFQKKCLGKLGDVSKGEGRTVLFVSHNLQAIEFLCLSGINLHNGKIGKIGTAHEAINFYLNESKAKGSFGIKSTIIVNHFLQIDSFYADVNPIQTFDGVNITLSLNFLQRCVIGSICILIYNELNERVAIIDLREKFLLSDIKFTNDVSLRVEIEELNLVDGEYNVGLFVETDLFYEDFFDLWKLVIKNRLEKVISYSKKARGYVELKYDAKLI